MEEKARADEMARLAENAKAKVAALKETGAWCRVVCMERAQHLAEYNVSTESIIVDGSSHSLDSTR